MSNASNFKAMVNFGATVDPSFGQSVTKIGKALGDAAEDAAKEVSKLTKEQAKLAREIKEGVLAGRDVTELKKQYSDLSTEIERTSRKLSRLNALGKAGAALRGAGSFAIGMTGRVAGAAGMASGVIAGSVAGAVALNADTAQQLGKAQGYSLDFGTHMAYQNIGKAIGIDEDSVGDLLDEMKNKIGEADNEQMLNPLLAQIGMTKASANRMMKDDPNKLFSEVMGKLSAAIKSGKMSAGEAGSFADQLLGGEAQKVVSFMAALGMSFEDLTAAGKKYNLVTEEGARQAAKGQYALNSLWGVVSSGLKEFTGRILGTASGDVLGIADGLKSTLEAKIPEITKAVTDWFAPDEEDKTGPERLRATVTEIGDTMVKFGLVMANIVDYLSFLLPETRRPEQMDSPAEARQRAKEMAGKKADAKDFGWDLVGRAAFIEEQVLEGEAAWFRAQNRLNDIGMGDIDMSGIYTPSPEITTQQSNNVVINVAAASGQSPESFGEMLQQDIGKILSSPKPSGTYDFQY